MQNEQNAFDGSSQRPRWGQLQHQFCKPEDMLGAPVVGPEAISAPDTVVWPGDPPSVTVQAIVDEATANTAFDQGIA